MAFAIIRNDITKVAADAIVNTANPRPTVGGGTDTAVYRAAGKRRLLAQRKKIGDIAPGQAAATPAFRLPAKYILHTVSPAWTDGRHGERETLRACYANALALADSLGCESAAFPLLAAGSCGFPKDEALSIALSEIGKFLLTHEMDVTLVVFDPASFALSASLTEEIEQFIDDRTALALQREEHSRKETRRAFFNEAPEESLSAARRDADEELLSSEKASRALRSERREESEDLSLPSSRGRAAKRLPGRFREQDRQETASRAQPPVFEAEDALPSLSQASRAFDTAMTATLPVPSRLEEKDLEEVLNSAGQTFQQKLFELIDASGMDDVTVYKKANIDRKVFSRIRCKSDYKPKKRTAVAFAIALELDMPAMLDLLARAEIAFSPSSKFDLIVAYFITHRIYDIFEINAALFKYGQPILGE